MDHARLFRAVDAMRSGRMLILMDDRDRENEGDVVIAAEHVTPGAINFMATHAKGLICVALTSKRVAQLDLPMMVAVNTSALGTGFTVSVEAKDGVTTGISAQDRATTIRLLADKQTRPEALVRPGHVFPLRAKDGGVLQRRGQTEGSVDLARLAGIDPSAVICEIMDDDGTMARLPRLERFAREFDMPLVHVADIVAYLNDQESLR